MTDQVPALLAHSKLGASSMKRWRNCPGSVKLCANMPNVSSSYAEEGTLAHDIAYKTLTARVAGMPEPDLSFGYSQDFRDAVKIYIDHVWGLRRGNFRQWFEHRFNLGRIFEGCFGTSDAVTYYPDEKLLVVSDYKHGAGVYVDVFNNDQLRYYALGSVVDLGVEAHRIRLEIIQPRLGYGDDVRSWEIDIFDLLEFADDLRNAALETQKPDAVLRAGEWCGFCPARAVCPLLKAKAKEWLATPLEMNATIDMDRLAEFLDWAPRLEAFIKAGREMAYEIAMKGVAIPGHKLVEKRARREWRNAQEAEEILKGDLISDAIYEPQALKSPSQIEKTFGKNVKKIVADLTVSKSSGYTLVSEDDNRSAATPGKIDFDTAFGTTATGLSLLN